jgi:hypothetical protein
MKKKALVLGLISMMLVSALALTGCSDPDDDTPPPASTPTTGTVTITNNSAERAITRVSVLDADTQLPVTNEPASIAIRGGSKSFTVDPGKYLVRVTDDANNQVTSTQFTLTAGGSKSLNFTGTDLY